MRSFKIKPRSSRVFLVACFLSHQGTFREGSWRFCSIPRTPGPPLSSPRLCGIFHSRMLLPFLLIPTICEDLEDVFLLFSTASFSKNCTFKKKKSGSLQCLWNLALIRALITICWHEMKWDLGQIFANQGGVSRETIKGREGMHLWPANHNELNMLVKQWATPS